MGAASGSIQESAGDEPPKQFADAGQAAIGDAQISRGQTVSGTGRHSQQEFLLGG